MKVFILLWSVIIFIYVHDSSRKMLRFSTLAVFFGINWIWLVFLRVQNLKFSVFFENHDHKKKIKEKWIFLHNDRFCFFGETQSILIYKMIAFVCIFGINSETTYSKY